MRVELNVPVEGELVWGVLVVLAVFSEVILVSLVEMVLAGCLEVVLVCPTGVELVWGFKVVLTDCSELGLGLGMDVVLAVCTEVVLVSLVEMVFSGVLLDFSMKGELVWSVVVVPSVCTMVVLV